MKTFPAIDVRTSDSDLLLALVDDYSPTALEDRPDGVRVFFATPVAREAALAAVASQFATTAVDVPDEDWARRSQENLGPITVGAITIVPRVTPRSTAPSPDSIHIVIEPSMGFGTGHHATTRLCLAALQTVDVRGRSVLDVGTGSGVLALAAARLGAQEAVGIDVDPDAIQCAEENLARNPDATGVRFAVQDLSELQNWISEPTLIRLRVGSESAQSRLRDGSELDQSGLRAGSECDVVTANLTGALLIRSATRLLALVRPGGLLILSGILAEERDAVRAAFAAATAVWEQTEDEWVGLAVKRS